MYRNLFIVVELNDGSKETFSISTQGTNEMAEKIRFKDFFQSNYLIFSTEDDVLMFPVNSVRSIRMSKNPPQKGMAGMDSLLPAACFKNASRL